MTVEILPIGKVNYEYDIKSIINYIGRYTVTIIQIILFNINNLSFGIEPIYKTAAQTEYTN